MAFSPDLADLDDVEVDVDDAGDDDVITDDDVDGVIVIDAGKKFAADGTWAGCIARKS